ncbi:MAG: protein translocase subunit SecDF [Bacteroidales bacterium]|nr:protein translocase subunit SecDF [Bacteroidales bacterium]
MQSRGAIKFFAIVFALVCLFQLSFTFFTSKVESDADDYAHSQVTENIARNLAAGDEFLKSYLYDSIAKARESYYLDSMSGEVVYNILVREYTYQDCKEREINLGLDLKGGMNVTLEVRVGDIIKALSGNSQNEVFKQALAMTYEKQKASQEDFITLFGESFEEVDPDAKLASVFNTVELRDKINYNSTNEEVLAVIREETESAIDRAFNILNTRINRFGVAQPNIQKLATTGRILVELPGIKDPERVRKLLQGTAKLEFWETYEFSELQPYFAEANEKLRKVVESERLQTQLEESVEGTGEEPEQQEMTESGTEESTEEGTNLLEQIEGEDTLTEEESSLLDQIESDTATQAEDQTFEEYEKQNPLYAYLTPAYYQNQQGQWVTGEGATVGFAAIKDTSRVNYLLRKVKNIFPRDLKLHWTVKPRADRPDVLELVALKVTSRDGTPALGGDVIVDARQDYNQNGQVIVSLDMNSEGARTWKRITGENIGRQIAIVLDDYVYSHPVVQGEIPSGRTQISGGNMDINGAKDLANILKAGKLPAPARIVEEAVVGPSLGREAINAGLWSFVLAFALVLVYMVMYYNRAGWVADLALLTNIFFLFGVLASLQAVLTLPGIAGIVLTLGMAVDANVIIYERIKEEVRAGKGIRLAIADGYKNAYSAIIDGNVTTLLTGIVLFIFGSGPVKGFATTLIIGILTSLFSAIFISRLVFTYFLDKNKKVNFANSKTQDFLANVNIDFLSMRKGAYIFSTVIILLGIGSLFVRGLNFGVDFTGGRTFIVRFDEGVQTNAVRDALTAEFDNTPPEVKTFGPSKQVKITTKYMIDNEAKEVDSIIQRKLFNGLQGFYAESIEYKDFVSDSDLENKLVGILSSQKVGPTIADDIRNKATMAITFALIVIFAYIAMRFRRWQFGLAGVIALFHDSLITIGLFSLFYNILPFNMEIDQAFIAAILTIIGYSINDSVIIFDRIREFFHLHPKKDMKENINDALNSTLSRTINTSGTTLVVLIIIFIFGGEIIRGFTFALLMGILIGTYSSLFNASPVAFDLIKSRIKTKAEKMPKGGKKRK